MLSAALRRDAGHGAFNELEQCLLHALAGDIACDARVVALARDLVDLVDVDNAALRPLDVVVAVLQQLADDVLDILAHIARFGQRGGIGHHERHIELARQGLRQERLARAGGADQEDVALGEFDIVLARMLLVAQALVMVVDRHRQGALGLLLADHIAVQIGLDIGGGGQVCAARLVCIERGLLVADDFVAQVNALIADEHRRPGDQFLDFMLALAAKRAIQGFFAGRAFFFGHGAMPRNAECEVMILN